MSIVLPLWVKILLVHRWLTGSSKTLYFTLKDPMKAGGSPQTHSHFTIIIVTSLWRLKKAMINCFIYEMKQVKEFFTNKYS